MYVHGDVSAGTMGRRRFAGLWGVVLSLFVWGASCGFIEGGDGLVDNGREANLDPTGLPTSYNFPDSDGICIVQTYGLKRYQVKLKDCMGVLTELGATYGQDICNKTLTPYSSGENAPGFYKVKCVPSLYNTSRMICVPTPSDKIATAAYARMGDCFPLTPCKRLDVDPQGDCSYP